MAISFHLASSFRLSGRTEDNEEILTMLKIGQRVRLVRQPPWVTQLPQESQSVFEYCVGRVFPVAGIDQQGLLVLDVSQEVDARFGGFMNDIRVESEFVTEDL
jgi:hypothetical protein